MKKMIVGFSRSKKFLPLASILIRFYQNTSFSHTYIKLPFKHRFPSDKILHASEGLIQNMSGTQFDKKHKVINEFEIEISDDIYFELLSVMHELAGDDYSVLQNIGIILVDIARYFGIRMTNPFKKGWNCSEFVAEILKRIYPNKFNNIDPNTVTPKEIYVILESLCEDCNIKKLY